MLRKIILVLLPIFTLLAVSHAWEAQAKTLAELGPNNLWSFKEDGLWEKIHEKCGGSGGFSAWGSSTKKLGIVEKRAQASFIQCITSQMQKAGASPQAIAFTKQMKGEVYMGQFREMGKVDLAKIVAPTLNDPNVEDFILVNGTPRIVYLWENVDKIDLTRDSLYPSLKRQYPNIEMWPMHDFVEMQNLAQGGQRFLFDFALRNGCRGCDIAGSAEMAFDFDAGGQFLGTKLVCLKEPSASDACSVAPIQTIPPTCDKNALISALNDPASDKVTIFVDGIAPITFIDFINVLWRGPWLSREVNYLCKSPLANVLKLKIPSVHGAIFWNGDLEDDVALEGAVAELQTLILQLTRAGKQIDLITHSFGTVIAYSALSRIDEKSYARPIANLVTLASPLGHEKFLPWVGQKYPALNISKAQQISPPDKLNIKGFWINAYAKEDLIGGRINITEVMNISESVPDAKPWMFEDSIDHRLEAHSAPYSNPLIYTRVINLLKASRTSTSEQGSNSLPLKPGTKYKKEQQATSITRSKAKKDTRAGCNKGSSVLSPSTSGAQGALKKYGAGTDGCAQ